MAPVALMDKMEMHKEWKVPIWDEYRTIVEKAEGRKVEFDMVSVTGPKHCVLSNFPPWLTTLHLGYHRWSALLFTREPKRALLWLLLVSVACLLRCTVLQSMLIAAALFRSF